jgi:tRNA pseudouridine55 synthase
MAMVRSGILLIDKPEGPSSARVVGRLKGILRPKRIGHLGTLDPFASGLLPVGINEGTKLAEIFLRGTKTYRGVMKLGIATETQDCTGKIREVRPVVPVGKPDLEALEQQFTGDLRQVPPMFSALRKNGVRLYRLARQGREVAREARAIRVEALRLRKFAADEIEFELTCSRGTYVRTLAADIGEALGCGAHLKALRRLRCDHLAVEHALTPDQVERLSSEGEVPLIALDDALKHIRPVSLESRSVARLRLGQQQILAQIARPEHGDELLRVQDSNGQLAALLEWDGAFPGGRWQILRVFNA